MFLCLIDVWQPLGKLSAKVKPGTTDHLYVYTLNPKVRQQSCTVKVPIINNKIIKLDFSFIANTLQNFGCTCMFSVSNILWFI